MAYTDEEWAMDDPETVWHWCERCGKDSYVQLVSDPYLKEVEGSDYEEPPEYWCYSCWLERKEDV